MTGQENDAKETRYAPMVNPKWAGLFLFGGGAVLIILGVLVRMLFGFSAASDQVFAIEALVSGLAVIWFIRYRFRRKAIVASFLKIPFIYVWLALCAFVFVFRPFE